MSYVRSEKKGTSVMKTIFCVFLAVYPILCLYKGFYRFTIGDLGLMAFTVLGVLPPPKQDKRIVSVAIFLVYSVFIFLLNVFVFDSMPSWGTGTYFFRLVKLIFYLVAAFTCGKKYFDLETFEKAVITVGVAAAVFMLFQYFAFYVMGRVYLGFIPGLTIFIEEYASADYEKLYSNTFRPCSIFLEPAMYAQYMVVPTGIALFSRKLKWSTRIFFVGFFSLSILLSTSAQGIIYLAIIFAMYAFVGTKRKTNAFVFVVVIIVAALLAYAFIDAFRFAVDRLLYSEGALSARTGTYKYILDMPGPFWFMGYGYGVVPNGEYMAGAAYVWYGCGVLGFLLVINMFLSFFKNANSRVSRVLCMIFFAAFFATSLFYNYMLFWYVALIISTDNRNKYRRHHYREYVREHD